MTSTVPKEPYKEQSSQASALNVLGGRKLEKQWENNLESLQSQIVDILGAVDKDKVDVTVGQTAIRNDQAVVLAWNKNQTLKKGFKLQDKVDNEDEGVLLYLAIRYNRNPKASNDEQRSNSASPASPNTAITNENRDDPSHVSYDGSPRLKELIHDENNNSGANSRESNSTHNSVPNDLHISSVSSVDFESSSNSSSMTLNTSTLPKAAILPKISLSEDNSGSEESYYHDYYPASYDDSTSQVPSSQDFIKKKRKKSVHWRENLEDCPSSKPLYTPSSSSSLESEELSATKIQQRPQSSRRASASDEARRRSSRDSFQRQQQAQLQQQQRISLLRRQLSVDHPSQSVTPRRSRSLDDISSNEGGRSVSSYRRRDSRVRRPCSRRTRSCSPEPDWSQPLGVLTTKTDPSSLRLDSNVVLPQTPSKIRRLRSKNARFSKNIWYVGSTEKSFNSRCSKKFYIDDLDENSAHYYYFRSYPKVAPSSSSISTSTLTNYSPSSKTSSSTKFE